MRKLAIVLLVCAFILGIAGGASAGLLGTYYNYSSAHPDMETSITGLRTGWVQPTLTGQTPTLTALGSASINQFDWWDSQYQVFQRVDSDVDLQSNFDGSWFPVNTGLSGDPQHFGVHWEGQFLRK